MRLAKQVYCDKLATIFWTCARDIPKDMLFEEVQLTLRQHWFELHGSTYRQIFPVSSSIVLPDSQLVKYIDAEPEILRSDYKVIGMFPTCKAMSPVVHWSTVFISCPSSLPEYTHKKARVFALIPNALMSA